MTTLVRWQGALSSYHYHRLKGRQHQGPDDCVSVRHAGQAAVDGVKGGSMVTTEPASHHDGPTAVAVVLPDGGVSKALPRTSSDANATIIEL